MTVSLALLLPSSPVFLLLCSLYYCSLAPGDLESTLKVVQAARGGGRGKVRGRGGKVRDTPPPSYSSVVDGHRSNKGRGGKRGGYAKHTTYCYQCGGGWDGFFVCCFN